MELWRCGASHCAAPSLPFPSAFPHPLYQNRFCRERAKCVALSPYRLKCFPCALSRLFLSFPRSHHSQQRNDSHAAPAQMHEAPQIASLFANLQLPCTWSEVPAGELLDGKKKHRTGAGGREISSLVTLRTRLLCCCCVFGFFPSSPPSSQFPCRMHGSDGNPPPPPVPLTPLAPQQRAAVHSDRHLKV